MSRADVLRPHYEQAEHAGDTSWLSPEHYAAAQELAISILGPLGIMLYERAATSPTPEPVTEPAVETTPVAVESWQSPETAELPNNLPMQRLQGRAAIYFAEHSLN